jgi:transmembrane sensor
MSKQTPKLNQHILEEASGWFIDLNEGEPDLATREAFNTWLRRSPEHVRAFLQMSAFMENAGTFKKLSIDIEALIARAKQEDNIFPLALGGGRDANRTPVPAGMQSNNRAKRTIWAVAASLLLAVIIGLGTWGYTQRNVYTTGIGEQRSLTLEDASFVELNSKSRVRVNYSAKERTVELLAGQALFKVAKNPARPFIVRTGDTSVRAVGTQFDVYRKSSGIVVTVIEGKVAVGNRDSPNTSETPDAGTVEEGAGKLAGVASLTAAPGEVLLAAGEQLTIAPHRTHKPRLVPDTWVSGTIAASGTAVPEPKPVDVEAATAWTEQKLVFQDTPLREVVDEFNRYNRQQLVIHDPALYDFHVTGVFPSADSGRMLELLRQRFNVTINRSGEEIEITREP